MAAPISTALPAAPSRSDSPDVFEEKAFAFVGALEPFRVDLQAQADFVNTNVGPGSDAETVANIAADVTTVAGAADDITQLVANNWTKPFPTLAAATADPNIEVGDEISLKERTTGNGGGAMWDVVLASGVTPNTYNIVQCTGVGMLALDLRIDGVINVKQFGAAGDGVTDDSGAFTAAVSALVSHSASKDVNGRIYVPPGTYYLLTGVSVDDGTNNGGTIEIIGAGQDSTNIVVGADQIGIDGQCGSLLCSDFTIWSKPTWDATVANAGALSISRDTSGSGVYSSIGGRPRFVRITAYGFGSVGIGAIRMTKGLISLCRVTGCGKGISVPSPTTPTTTSEISLNYVSNCDIEIDLVSFTHGVYSNNVCEGGALGLSAVSCTGTVWEKLYFESHTSQHYYFLNSFPVFVGTITEVPGGAGTPPTASQNIYNASISATNMTTTHTEQDELSSTNIGILGYDSGASATKGLTFSRFKQTGPAMQTRGLRLINRNTASGELNSVGTFAIVNGAKAAHTSIVQVKADGTVLDSDEMIASVSKLATGEYSLNLASSTHPDHVNIATYQVYATGATPVRNAQWSMTSANLTTHETGRTGLVQKIYVTITDAAGTLQDSGFTAEIKWNRSDDLTS